MKRIAGRRLVSPVLLLLLLGLLHPLRAQEGSASVHGTVLAAESGEPIRNAVVILDGEDRAALTDSAGSFTLVRLDPGRHVLEVSHLGRRSKQVTVDLAAGEAVEVSLSVEIEPVELPGLEVAVERRVQGKMAGFYRRMERGSGHYITREEIAEIPGGRVSSVMRRVPNVNVRPCSQQGTIPPPGCMQVSMRRKAPSIRFSARTCQPHYYLDGTRIQLPRDQGGIDAIDLQQLEAVEVYRGPSEIPARYGGSDAQCGVVLLWTRTGREEREPAGG